MQILLNKRIWLICTVVVLLIAMAFCANRVINELSNTSSQVYTISSSYNDITSSNSFSLLHNYSSKFNLTEYNQPSNIICKTNTINYSATRHYLIGFGVLLFSVFIIIFGIVYFCEHTYNKNR